jgi:hypothetical protein
MDEEVGGALHGDAEQSAGSEPLRSHIGDETVRRIRRAEEQVEAGHLGRAAMQLMPTRHAPPNERTVALLEAKHLQRDTDHRVLPELPADAPFIMEIAADVWSRTVKSLDNGSSAGLSGLNGQHIRTLVEHSPVCSDQLKQIVIDMVNGVFVGCRAELWMSAARVIPFLKHPDPLTSSIRDLKIEEVVMKLAGKVGMTLLGAAAADLFPCIQFGVCKPAGVETAAHVIRDAAEWMETRPGYVKLQLDAEHAFGTQHRKQILQFVLRCRLPQLALVRRLLFWMLGHTNYSVYYRADGTVEACFFSDEGLLQGGPWGSLLYSATVQEAYQRSLLGTHAQAVAVVDDFTVLATLEDAIRVTDQLQHELAPLGVRLNRAKTIVHHPAGPMTAAQLQQLTAAGLPHPGDGTELVEVLGSACCRDPARVIRWACDQVRSHDELLGMLVHPAMSKQNALLLLRASMLPRLSYVQRVTKPALAARAMMMLQERVETTFLRIADISEDEAIPSLITMIKLPIVAGGCGLGDATVTSHAAFTASVAAASATITLYRQQRNSSSNNSSSSISSSSISSSSRDVLEADVQASLQWLAARHVDSVSTGGALPPVGTPFLPAMQEHDSSAKLQHIITIVHAAAVAGAARLTESAPDRARINSLTCPHAGAWLITTPTSPELELSDLQMQMAIRNRCGLSMQRGGSSLRAMAQVRGSPGWGLNARHDHVKRAVQWLAQSVGAFGHAEPLVGAGTTARADLLLHLVQRAGIHVLVDVMITDPLAHPSAAQTQLGAASVGELQKRDTYQQLINPSYQLCAPFVVETFGAIGRDALALLHDLAEHSAQQLQQSSIQFMRRAIPVISFAIQRGNSELVFRRRMDMGGAG